MAVMSFEGKMKYEGPMDKTMAVSGDGAIWVGHGIIENDPPRPSSTPFIAATEFNAPPTTTNSSDKLVNMHSVDDGEGEGMLAPILLTTRSEPFLTSCRVLELGLTGLTCSRPNTAALIRNVDAGTTPTSPGAFAQDPGNVKDMDGAMLTSVCALLPTSVMIIATASFVAFTS